MATNSKMIVFNVGAGFASFLQIDDKRIMIDCGESGDFCPVEDFLVPLAKKQSWKKGKREEGNGNKYILNQLVITHPHQDHLSGICELNEKFCFELITCPSDNLKVDENNFRNYKPDKYEKLNWDLITQEDLTEEQKKLKEVTSEGSGRALPLRPCINTRSLDEDTFQLIYRLLPGLVEGSEVLCGESYPNNVSLVQLLKIKGATVLVPGDIQKEGMKVILDEMPLREVYLDIIRKKLQDVLEEKGINILIAPHHGHKSSFSIDLFNCLPDGKVDFTIIPEKPVKDRETDIDKRYRGDVYNRGISADKITYHWDKNESDEVEYSKQTSVGHIGIEFLEDGEYEIHIFKTDDFNGLLEFFED